MVVISVMHKPILLLSANDTLKKKIKLSKTSLRFFVYLLFAHFQSSVGSLHTNQFRKYPTSFNNFIIFIQSQNTDSYGRTIIELATSETFNS